MVGKPSKPLPEPIKRRRCILVEDELGGEADDAAGAEAEKNALAGGELLGGDKSGDAPAWLSLLVPDLAANYMMIKQPNDVLAASRRPY